MGYRYSLGERTAYDPVHSRGIDTWWEAGAPDRTFTQTIRCYTPADLRLLLEGTGLTLVDVLAGGRRLDLDAAHPGQRTLLREEHEYLAVLRPGH